MNVRLNPLIRYLPFVFFPVLVSAFFLSYEKPSFAQENIDKIRLKLKDTDFRVRLNAVLSLSAIGAQSAQSPNEEAKVIDSLCGVLADASVSVRQASVAGLQKTAKPKAKECLKQRMGTESESAVKLQIADALLAWKEDDSKPVQGPFVPPQNPRAKYYVSVFAMNNKSGKSDEYVQRILMESVAKALTPMGDFQLAPFAESVKKSQDEMKKRKLKGYSLSVSIEPFGTDAELVKSKVNLAVATLPGRSLKGTAPAGASASSEELALRTSLEYAAELFGQNLESFR